MPIRRRKWPKGIPMTEKTIRMVYGRSLEELEGRPVRRRKVGGKFSGIIATEEDALRKAVARIERERKEKKG